MRVVYFGTPHISAKIFEQLLKSNHEVVGVVTQPDKPRGRQGAPSPSPVAALAGSCPLFKPATCRDPHFQKKLSELEADLFVVVAFGQILPQAVLDIPPKGCINVHASLLPKYRGAAPMQRALMEGVRETGVTIMEMALKMDAGAMLLKKTIPLSRETTLGDLEQETIQVGGAALLEAMERLDELVPESQDEALVTFAPKIEKEECLIDWSLPVEKIVCHIHGLSPKPGAYTMVEVGGRRLRLKILRARVGGAGLSYRGVELCEVQLEGSRAMQAREFLRGFPTMTFLN